MLIRLPQAGGALKLRPALVLAILPGPYQNVLICGVSTQLRNVVPGWDEIIDASEPGFSTTGLRRTSAIRLSYLYAAEQTDLAGAIGAIDPARLKLLQHRLGALLVQSSA